MVTSEKRDLDAFECAHHEIRETQQRKSFFNINDSQALWPFPKQRAIFVDPLHPAFCLSMGRVVAGHLRISANYASKV